VTLLDQTVLRAPDGRRWVVQTLRTTSGYTTTARLTGCDLTPAGTVVSTSSDEASRAHARFADVISQRGQLE
jgi:hypothetical protein